MAEKVKPDRNFMQIAGNGGAAEKGEKTLKGMKGEPDERKERLQLRSEQKKQREEVQKVSMNVEQADQAEEQQRRAFIAGAGAKVLGEALMQSALTAASAGEEVEDHSPEASQAGEGKGTGDVSMEGQVSGEEGKSSEQQERMQRMQQIRQLRAQRVAVEQKKKQEKEKEKKKEGMFDFLLKWHAFPFYMVKKGFQRFKII